MFGSDEKALAVYLVGHFECVNANCRVAAPV